MSGGQDFVWHLILRGARLGFIVVPQTNATIAHLDAKNLALVAALPLLLLFTTGKALGSGAVEVQ